MLQIAAMLPPALGRKMKAEMAAAKKTKGELTSARGMIGAEWTMPPEWYDARGGRNGRAARAEDSYQNDLRQWLRSPGARTPTKKLTHAATAYKKALAAKDDGMGAGMVGAIWASRPSTTG